MPITGVLHRAISNIDILGRCLQPVMSDGVVILVEGIATCASGIEVDRVYGFGSRRCRGGSMLYELGVGWDMPS